MVKGMKRRDVESALVEQGCKVLRDKGDHTVWGCPESCKAHKFSLPRHTQTSPGVVRDAIKKLACLPEGWLQ